MWQHILMRLAKNTTGRTFTTDNTNTIQLNELTFKVFHLADDCKVDITVWMSIITVLTLYTIVGTITLAPDCAEWNNILEHFRQCDYSHDLSVAHNVWPCARDMVGPRTQRFFCILSLSEARVILRDISNPLIDALRSWPTHVSSSGYLAVLWSWRVVRGLHEMQYISRFNFELISRCLTERFTIQ